MQHTKGFSLVAVSLIIVAVLAVSGVAYFAGKSAAPQNEVADNSNHPPTTEQNYAPPAANTTPPATNTATGQQAQNSAGSGLCSGITEAKIIIENPAANQTHAVSSPFSVKWHTCNIPATHTVHIGLMPAGEFQGAPPMIPLSSATANDGTETFTLSDFGVSAGTYTVFMKDNDLPNGTTNAWSGQFTVTAPAPLSTVLPQYISAAFGSWPPVIQASSAAYSCAVGSTGGDTPTVTEQRTIGARTYCVSKGGDGYTGGYSQVSTYTTASGSGTKTTNFTLLYQSCSVWQGDGTTKYSNCQAAQSAFNASLDSLIDSLL